MQPTPPAVASPPIGLRPPPPDRVPRPPTPNPTPTWAPTPEPLALVSDTDEPTSDAAAEVAVARFDEFYRTARPSIARALSLTLGDVDLATEATDEAMARAYERWGLVSRLERPEGWVYRVAMNWALSVLRRRRRSDHRLYDPGDTALAIADPDVHAAIGELDVHHRSVVVCRHLLGWSTSDTAAALKVREGTVKSRLSRATRILQARLHHLRDHEEPK